MTLNINITKPIKICFLIILTLIASSLIKPVFAQQLDLGADVMNRYVWRGFDFGNSPSIQPSLTYTSSGFEIGTWGAYPLSTDASTVEEHDLYVSYTFDTGMSSSITLNLTDYYFPNGGVKFFNFEGDGAGAHWIEPSISYTGPSSFPITLYGGVFVHNDPDNSVYLEAGYPVYVGETEVAFSVGGTLAESEFYLTDKAGILNITLSASRTIPISEAFELPLLTSYVLNPYHQQSFLLFGFSL